MSSADADTLYAAWQKRLDALEDAIGYHFTDRGLLERAMTHPSFANEREEAERNNQRMEFLGDAVLELVVASLLFADEELRDEGALTRRLSALVCERALSAKARALRLGEHILLGRGEEAQGGRTRKSILCDAYEALMAAVYLDGGFDAARRVITAQLAEDLHAQAPERTGTTNHKGALQRLAQQRFRTQPTYHIVSETGPDHDKQYIAEVVVGELALARGEGGSKKQAEQHAAEQALTALAAE